jgi:hypothetical protein
MRAAVAAGRQGQRQQENRGEKARGSHVLIILSERARTKG